jgi:hypothetical protein
MPEVFNEWDPQQDIIVEVFSLHEKVPQFSSIVIEEDIMPMFVDIPLKSQVSVAGLLYRSCSIYKGGKGVPCVSFWGSSDRYFRIGSDAEVSE